jgi:hypothetical protein
MFGCINSEQGAKKRIANLLKRFPNAVEKTVKIDSVEKVITITIKDTSKEKELEQKFNQAIDSALSELKDCKDTVIYKTVVKRIKDVFKEKCKVEDLISAKTYDTLGVKIKITPIGNSIKVEVIAHDIIKTETNTVVDEQKNGWLDWYWWLLIGFVLGIILMLYAKK